jgi:hypothetical protein
MQNGFGLLLFVAWSLVPIATEAQSGETSRTRIVLDSQPVTVLRLARHVSTTIVLPEAVNAIVVGDPNLFQAEHSPNEPFLVFVKPVASNAPDSTLLISTIHGRRFIFFLTTGSVDLSAPDLLVICRVSGIRFIDQTFPTALIAETVALTNNTQGQPTVDEDTPLDSSDILGLDKLVQRQSGRVFPKLYGEGIRVGIGETFERGGRLIVSFSVFNSGSSPVELVPPQVQLAGQITSGIIRRRSRWFTVQQLLIDVYRMTRRRLDPGDRVDGLVVFERPTIKQSHEQLLLQIADSAAVDRPVLSPIYYRQTNGLEK